MGFRKAKAGIAGELLNAKSSEERVVYKKAERNGNVDSENNHGGSSRKARSEQHAGNWTAG